MSAAYDLATRPTVALVIPGRNCQNTLESCLTSVIPLKETGQVSQIVFVDDGSADASISIAQRLGVQVLKGSGGGPGHARNLGWRNVNSDLVWFIDSDCISHPETLLHLQRAIDDPTVAGAGGGYWNVNSHSLLATTIDREIEVRHRTMLGDVDFLGGFNVLYRRSVLEAMGGFDEQDVNGPGSAGAEDCELSFRISDAGYRLRFVKASVVGHHHPTSLRRYLRTQARHGYWRARLYAKHPDKAKGDSYTSYADFAQPVAALTCLGLLPFAPFPVARWAILCSFLVLLASSLPIARQLLGTNLLTATFFVYLCTIRSFWRSVGIVLGVFSCWISPPKKPFHECSKAVSFGVGQTND